MKRLLIVSIALSLAGCGQIAKGAKQYFVEKYSCPAERVILTPMQGARPSDVFAADAPGGTPPDDVKADPGRLAQWRSEQAELHKNWETWINSSELFDASGCGHRVVLACSHPGRGSSPGVTASCEEAPSGKR